MKTPKIWFEGGFIYLQTADNKVGRLSLKSFPRLYNATDEQLGNYKFSPMGVHWQCLDEDLSFDGFFADQPKAPNRIAEIFAAFPEINVNQFARLAGINQSLMAKYICGIATPSQSRAKQIEQTLHRIGNELTSVTI